MADFTLVFILEYVSTTHFAYPMSVTTLMYWLYYACMESSPYQATFGKMVMHLKVTDMNLQRISFLRASLRWFCKCFSIASFGIGFILIVCTKKKQALHDIMANCVIIACDETASDKY